jgi:hypothetical protein
MCVKQKYEMALSFWTVSFQYLSLVQYSASEIAEMGNKWVIIDDEEIDENEYEERTKWSDHSLIIPLLFNLYHGTELLVKGFLIARGCGKKGHNIEYLCHQFAREYPEEKEINEFLAKYTNEIHLPPILNEFLAVNELNFRDFYQALRYPSDENFQKEKIYANLKYKGENGLQFFFELQKYINNVRYASRKLELKLKKEIKESE